MEKMKLVGGTLTGREGEGEGEEEEKEREVEGSQE